MSLEFQNVSYHYPGTEQGLSDLSLSVNSGELVAIIGPSGSGKSTLLKLVSGLTSGHSGSIRLGGQDLVDTPVHLRNIGMVFQNYALFPHLNVLDNISYGLKLRKVAKELRDNRAKALLDAVGMSAFADRAVSQLSGGQQQRVALARALAIDPKALLLDEPLAALDASIRGQLRDQIREIQKRFNATTLLVTHDQEEALAMADRVAVLKDGCLLQLATPKDIYERPASTTVAQFVGLSTIFEGTVLAQDLIDIGFVRLVVPTQNRGAGQTIHALIRPEHVQIDPAESALNRMPGHVGARRYLGSLSRFDFHVPGAAVPFLCESRNVPAAAIAIAPEHICLLDS
jgi:putative spermidine/putrescine transport system ATP-binding protein